MKRFLVVVIVTIISHSVCAQEYAASYRVTFVGEWSQNSHPIDYPGGAHFSPLVGHTHDENGKLWQEGQLATSGIEVMAENGQVNTLRNEIIALANLGFSENYLIGDDISATGMTSIQFDISLSHPQISIVTMIAPSPDWFVGIDGLSLLENQFWVEELMVELLPYDSGTDSGTEFTSPNDDTNPPELIARITTNPFPNSVPLGVFLFERLSVTGFSPDVVFANTFETN